MADQLIFQPPGTPYPENRLGFEKISGGDGEVAIFHLKPGPGMPTILWSHGNAQNLRSLKPALEYLHLRGFGVISYDYPGYGESSGSPSEKGCYRAIESTYKHLCDEAKVAPQDIILLGQSVGTGPTTWLAANEEHRAVVLISPFLSAFRTVTQVPILPGDRFPNAKHIQKFSTPLIVIHGEEDKVIPFKQGQSIYDRSPSSQKTFIPVPNAGHNDLFTKGEIDLGKILFQLVESNPSPAEE